MSRLLMWLALVFLVLFAVRSKLRELQMRNQPRRGTQDAPGAAAGGQGGQGGQGGAAGADAGGGTAGWRARAAQRASDEAETMLCCAHCGVYYPASETVQLNGLDYCSPAHAGLPPR